MGDKDPWKNAPRGVDIRKVKGMTEQEYNKAEGIRRSSLWKMKRSAAHFFYELNNPPEPTPALMLGEAVHTAVLGDYDEFWKRFSVIGSDLRTKTGREARDAALASGKAILTEDMFQTVDGIVESVFDCDPARRLLAGEHETAYFWTDEPTGERCKCRTDSEVDIDGVHYIVDLKTCTDASTEAFRRDVFKYGYHVQAAMYCEGVKHVKGVNSRFKFIAVEKSPPYAINILELNEDVMLKGYDTFRELLGIYHQCKTFNEWPDFCGFGKEDTNVISLPPWEE